MTNANEQEQKRPLTLARTGARLELRKSAETGQVRQSFSHGRAEEEARQRSEDEAQRRKEEESRREVAERAGKAAAAKVAALAAAGKVSVPLEEEEEEPVTAPRRGARPEAKKPAVPARRDE